MTSSKVPQLNLKQVEDVKKKDDRIVLLADELSKNQAKLCAKKDVNDDTCQVLGNASNACDEAVLEPYDDAKVEKCQQMYQEAAAKVELYLGNPTVVDEEIDEGIDFAALIDENVYEDDFEEPDFEHEYDDDFEGVYYITVVKGSSVTDSEHYFRRLYPSKLQGLKELQIEGDEAKIGPFLTKEDRKNATSELFDENQYYKSSSGVWMVNRRPQDENLDSDWFLKTKKEVDVADKITVASHAKRVHKRDGGKTRNRRHRRKSTKSSSKRIPRVVTKKHRRNRKTRKGK